MQKVLFVCLGNICRSPLAEGLFNKMITEKGLEGKLSCDSAGTGNWHEGETADPRMLKTAKRRGIDLTHRARQIHKTDIDKFDYIVAMDISVMQDMKSFYKNTNGVEILYMREFDVRGNKDMDVPDPWFGGMDGFDKVFELLEFCVGNFMKNITSRKAG